MPEIGRPDSGTATPAVNAASENVPSPLLRKRKFGTVSLATKASMSPSWS